MGASMIQYILKKATTILITLWIVASFGFILLRTLPGGPFDQEREVPVEVRAALDAKFHLNDSVFKQYRSWMGDLILKGDLGPSFKYPNRSVNEIIALSLPVSAQLGSIAIALALLFGVPIGILGAIREGSGLDHLSTVISLIGISLPRFILAPVLILLFSLTLYWLPVARWESARHMILPVICAFIPTAATISRLTRNRMIEILQERFILTAHAKGLSKTHIILKHALKGTLLPVVSFLGPGFSSLLVGSLVIEKIFDIPGMGRYFVEAATNRDYNLVMGVMLVYGGILMIFNALADIAYSFLDPRVEIT